MEFLPTTKTVPPLEFRELTLDEIKSVEHIFTDRGCALPDPKVSTFVGAVKDGVVVGFLVLQLKLHAEPMWLDEKQSTLFKPLVAKAEETILRKCGPAWVYLFAPAGRVAQLAATMGMMQEPWVVMSKMVMPGEPLRPPSLDDMMQEDATPGVEQ